MSCHGIRNEDEERPTKDGDNGAHRPRAAHRHHVEIATLSMPAIATESGVRSGDGTDFVLEAPAHVIDRLQTADDGRRDRHGQRRQHERRHQTKRPCIEGVVDLDVVSHLLSGITEEEFAGLLHHDMPHVAPHGEGAIAENDTEAAEKLEEGDGKTFSETSSEEEGRVSSGGIVIGGEDLPLLHGSSHNTGDANDNAATACLSLSADPFVQTLLEIHHQHDKAPEGKSEKEGGEDVTTVETIGATEASLSSSPWGSFRPSFVRGDHHLDAGSTVCREAFLLSVPEQAGGYSSSVTGATNGTEIDSGDTFVLALPETTEMAGVAGSSMHRHSVSSVSEAVADMAMNFDHAFDPLPTDIRNVDLRVSIVPVAPSKGKDYQEEVHLDVVVDRKVPVIGYVILVSGLVALSSIGAALDLQGGGVTPEMKILWRLSSTSLLFLWLAAGKLNKKEFAKFSRFQLCVELPFAAANYAMMNTTFAVSLEMTSLVNAFILSNMASLLMIGGKFALGAEVLFLEGLGAAIGFVGALVCAAGGGGGGEDDADVGDATNLETMGNIVAFAASVGTAIYLVVAKRLRPHVDLVLFMFLIFALATVFLMAYIAVLGGQTYEFSTDPVVGVFGWVNLEADRLPLELYVAVVCNGVGTMGYIAIMKYFDPVVVSMVMLTEPVVATLLGLAVGVSDLPGWVTWAGDAVVMVGSIMVIYAGSKKTETIDATDAIQNFDNDGDGGEAGTAGTPKLMKSPLLRRSKMMRSPLLVAGKQQRGDAEEMEFVSVGKKGHSRRPSGQRVIWSSMKSCPGDKEH